MNKHKQKKERARSLKGFLLFISIILAIALVVAPLAYLVFSNSGDLIFSNMTESSSNGARLSAAVLSMDFNSASENIPNIYNSSAGTSQGTYVRDNSIYNNFGTTTGYLNDMAWRNIGSKINNSLQFDGVDDYVAYNSYATYYQTISNATISFWVKTNSSSGGLFSTGYPLLAADGFRISLSSGKIAWAIYNSNTAKLVWSSTTATLSNDSWHNVIITCGISGNVIYIDGIQDAGTYTTGSNVTTSCLSDTSAQTTKLSIGGVWAYNNALTSFAGSLDEFYIWNKVLNSTDVSTIYLEGVAGRTINLTDDRNIVMDNRTSYLALDNNATLGENTTLFVDSWGANNGTCAGTNCPTTDNGLLTGAINFSGSQYISLTNDTSTNFNNDSAFTITFWIYRTTDTTFTLLDRMNSSSKGWKVYNSVGDGRIEFAMNSQMNVRTTDTSSLTKNQWHHFAIVYTGNGASTGFSFYLDGILTGTTLTMGGGPTSMLNSAPLFMGTNRALNNNFTGKLDEFMIFNRTLTASEVRGLMYSQIAHFPLDELSGSTTNSVFGPTATLTNYPALTTPIYNATGGRDGSGAYTFDGINDRIQTTFNPTGLNQITLSAWIYRTAKSASYDGILAARSALTGLVAEPSNSLSFYVNEDSSPISFTMPLNQWLHVVGVYNGTNSLLYVNGTLVASKVKTGIISTNGVYYIGDDPFDLNNRGFNGSIDNVQIFNRALSPSEVLALYNGTNTNRTIKYSATQGDFTSGVFSSSTLSYWNISLATSDTTNRSGIVNADNSINLSFPNLVSYWALDSNYLDAKGRNNGTGIVGTNGGLNNASGISSSAIRFDGVDDYINTTTTAYDLGIRNNSAYCTWFYLSGTGTSPLITDLRNGGTNGMFFYRESGGRLNFFMYPGNSNVKSVTVTSTNTWYHTCTIANGTNLLMYINGNLENNTNILAQMGNSERKIRIGSSDSGTYMNGTMDEVLIYNTSLSTSQVSQLYESGLSQHANTNITLQTRTANNYNVSDPSLRLFFPFDDSDIYQTLSTDANRVNTTFTYVADASSPSGGYHRVNGAAYWRTNTTFTNSGRYNLYVGVVRNGVYSSATPIAYTTGDGTFNTTINENSGTTYEWTFIGTNNYTANTTYLFNMTFASGWSAISGILYIKNDSFYDSTGQTNFTLSGTMEFKNSTAGIVNTGEMFRAGNYNIGTNYLNGWTAATFSAWVNAQSAPTGSSLWGIVNSHKSDNGDVNGLSLGSNIDFCFYAHVGGGACSGIVPQVGKWYHVAGTWNGTVAKIFINGVKMNNVTSSGAFSADNPLYIGKESFAGRYWFGYIDEVRVYNRSLADSEVVDLYNLGATHISDWTNWSSERLVQDSVMDSRANFSRFMQFHTNFYSNTTDVSPYVISYNINNLPTNINVSLITPADNTFIGTLTQDIINWTLTFFGKIFSVAYDLIFSNNLEANSTGTRLPPTILSMDFNSAPEMQGVPNPYGFTYVKDNSIYNNYGTKPDTHPWNPGKIGNGLGFDGVNDYVSGFSGITPVNGTTISMWINPRVVSGSSYGNALYAFGPASGCNPSEQIFGLALSKLYFNTGCGSYLYSSSNIITNNWTHVVVTIDSIGNATLYVNSIMNSNSTNTRSGQTVAAGNDQIGVMWTGGGRTNYFNGSLDEIMVFNRTLSQNEITALYNNQSQGFRNSGLETDSNLVSYWKLDEVLGMNASDARGVYNATLSNYLDTAPLWNATGGVNGSGAYQFDHIDDYINLGDKGDIGLNDFSCSFWIKSNSSLYQNIVTKSHPGAQTGRWWFGSVDGVGTKMDFNLDISGIMKTITVNNLYDNTWKHIVGTIKRDGNMTLYVNGVSVGTPIDLSTWSTTNFDTGDPLNFGAYNNVGGYFNGTLDNVQIFTKALSPQEVLELYNGSYANQTLKYYLSSSNFTSGVFYNIPSNYWNISFSTIDGNLRGGLVNRDNSINLSFSNLVSYWALDGNYLDAKGVNNGTCTGITCPNNASGLSSNALLFDGIIKNISVNASTSLDTENNNKNFTVSAWVYPLSYGGAYGEGVVQKIQSYGSGLKGYYLGMGRTSRCNGLVANNNYVENTGTGAIIPLNTWTNIIWTYNGTTLSCYLNVQNQWNLAVPANSIPNSTGQGFFIGQNGNGGSTIFNGAIDEVLFFNASLSLDQLNQIYESGLSQHANTNVTLQTRTANNYNVSDPSLVGFWALNNGTGENLTYFKDEKGVNNGTCTVGSCPTINNSGLVGNTYSFDGLNDQISVSTNTNLSQNLTISAWIYSSGSSCAGTIINQGWDYPDAGNEYGWSVYCGSNGHSNTNANSISWSSSDNSLNANNLAVVQTNAGVIQPNKWYHVGITKLGVNITIFLNGQFIKNGNVAVAPITYPAGNGIVLGHKYTVAGVFYPAWFNGSIDEVRIYNRSLSASEVLDLYNLGATHISDWTNWTSAQTVQDGVGQTTSASGKFVQFRSTFNSNTTDVSPYVLGYNVTALRVNPNIVYVDKNLTANISSGVGIANATITVVNASNTSQIIVQQVITYGAGILQSTIGIVVTLVDGIYNWFYSLIDWNNNGLTSVNRTITVDTINPLVNFVSPTLANNSISNLNYYFINASITEAYLANVNYTWNGSSYSIFDNSLVAMYNFDNVSAIGENATRVVDLSGNGNNASCSGFTCPNFNSSGILGGSRTFDGVNDYLTVPYSPSLAPTGNQLTFSSWFYLYNKTTHMKIISKTESGGYQLSLNENSVCNTGSLCGVFYIGGAYKNVSYPVSNLNTNQWYQAIAVYNGSQLFLYLNGNLVAGYSVSGAIGYTNNNPVCIGSEATNADCTGGFNFNGSIDEVKIWNRSLSAAEVNQLYMTGLQKINPSQWILTVNQSRNSSVGLVDGTYSYSVSTIDMAGNSNSTESRTIRIDATLPNATLITPGNNSYLNNASTNFTANISDNFIGLANATLNIYNASGVLVNQTFVNYSLGPLQATIGIIVNLVDGVYSWFYSLFDLANNIFASRNNTLTIDTTLPFAIFVSPTPDNDTGSNSQIVISLNVTEINPANATLDWGNTTTRQLYYFNSGNFTSLGNNIWNFNTTNKTALFAGQVYYYNITITDLAGNNNVTPTRLVRGNTAPRINFSASTTLNGFYNSSEIIANITSSDGEANMNATYVNLYYRNNWQNSTLVLFNQTFFNFSGSLMNLYLNYSNLSEGIYYLNATVTDSIGETSDTNDTKIIILDRSSPNSTLLIQNNSALNYTSVNLTMNLSDNLGVANATLSVYNSSNNLVNQTTLNFGQGIIQTTIGVVVDLVDGIYTWFYNLFDWAGNNALSGNNTLTTDTASASMVNIIYSPDNNDTLDPNTLMQFNVTIRDSTSGTNSAVLELYDGVSWQNYSMSPVLGSGDKLNEVWNTNFTTSSNETIYVFKIWTNDTSGNIIESANSTFYSTWDCSWIASLSPAAAAGFNANKKIANVIINNTGDINYTNDHCTLFFGLIHDIENKKLYFDNKDGSTKRIYGPVSVGHIANISLNYSFSDFVRKEIYTINITEDQAISQTAVRQVSGTAITTQEGPYLYQEASSNLPVYNIKPQTISITGYISNLMGSEVYNKTNSAFNVTSNWTIDSNFNNLSGNLDYLFENMTDSTQHSLDLELNATNWETILQGTYLFNISSHGYDFNGNLIQDTNNNSNFTNSVTISLVCYSIADGFEAKGCWPTDPDTVYCGNGHIDTNETCTSCTIDVGACGTTAGPAGPGPSGGSSTPSSGPTVIKSEANYELLRGGKQNFQLEVKNKYGDEMKNIKIIVSGLNSEYISISPDSIDSLAPGATRNVTVTISAPGYFSGSKYTLIFDINANLVSNATSGALAAVTDKRFVTLYIVEVDRKDATVNLNESYSLIEEMNASGLILKEVNALLANQNKAYAELNFLEVKNIYDQIKKIRDNAFESKQLIEEITAGIAESEKNGITIIESKKSLYLAQVAFARGDYALALERLKEAKLVYALEVKGEYNLIYTIKNNPGKSFGAIIFVGLFAWGSSLFIRLRLYKRKLKNLAEEEVLLLELMKMVQRQCFEEKKLSMEEYDQAMMQYESKLSETIEDKIRTETKMANLLRASGKRKALDQEKSRLIELIRKVQDDYLNKNKIETRIYEGMIKSYSSRLSEVDEQLAYVEAQDALKKQSKINGMFKV